MSTMHDNLSDLMRRETADLEPESDLVERGIRRGRTLSRRRTVRRGVAGGTALLTAAAGVVGGSQMLEINDAVAGIPAISASTATPSTQAKPPVATHAETLQTLRKLLPPGVQVSAPGNWGKHYKGFIGVSVLANDGKGRSLIEVSVDTVTGPQAAAKSCDNEPPGNPNNCKVRSDGATVRASRATGWRGVIVNSASVWYPDNRVVYISSTNAVAMKRTEPTRAQPLLSVDQLRRMADSQLWAFPPPVNGNRGGGR